MSLGRLRSGEWIVGLGALTLLLVTFCPWYQLGGTRLTAWDELESGRYFLLVTAIVGLSLLPLVATARSAQTSSLAAARTSAVGFACAVYVTYRLLKRPDALDADIGLFIGLASALLVTIGGLVSVSDRTYKV